MGDETMTVEDVPRPVEYDEGQCCGGKCRLAQIRRMSRDELMDAVVEAEEGLAMAESYISDLLREDASA